MTPEQCHPVHCNSQQVEGSTGWDRHSSDDLHNRQMDGQDEGSRIIYNQRDLTKRRTTIRKTPESSSCVVSEEEKKNSSSDEARGRTLTPPPTTPLTILLPNDPARPLTKSSQRPSSWARFSTKFIVLGLLGLGSLTSTVKDTPQIETLQLAPSVGRTWVLVRTIIEQDRAKPPRENDDGQPTGSQMENCQEVPSSTGVWHHVHGLHLHLGPDDLRTSWAALIGPRKTVAMQNTFKGLHGENSF